MKSNVLSKIIYPFENNTSNFLLIFGCCSFLLLCFLGYQWEFISDGIIQMHHSKPREFWKVFINNLINTTSLSLLMFFLARLIYSKSRFIDVLIVVLVTQVNLVFIAVILLNPMLKEITDNIIPSVINGDIKTDRGMLNQLFWISIASIFALLFLLLFFFLLVQGMKIAMNSKKGYHGIIIIVMTLLLDALLWITRPYIN